MANMFRSILSKIRPQRQHIQQPSPEAIPSQTDSALCQLPTELLLLVNEALPVSSQVCLILTCKEINLSVGNKCTATLQSKKKRHHERRRCLELLARDCPLLLPCYRCMKLHQREMLFKNNSCSTFSGHIDAFGNMSRLHYAHVQLIMSLHERPYQHEVLLSRLSRRERKILSALHRPVKTYRWGGVRMESELRVVNKRLLLRRQVKRNIDLQAEIDSLNWCCSKRPILYQICSLIRVISCRHGDPYIRGYEPAILPLLFDLMGSSSSVHYERSVMRLCPCCATEFRFSTEVSEGGTCSFTIVCWKDLGSGSAFTEDAWNSHSRLIVATYSPGPNSQQGIKEAFEGTEVMSPSEPTRHLQIKPFPQSGREFTDITNPNYVRWHQQHTCNLLRKSQAMR